MDLKFWTIFQSASSAEGGGRDPQRDVNNDGRGGGDGTGRDPFNFQRYVYIYYIYDHQITILKF